MLRYGLSRESRGAARRPRPLSLSFRRGSSLYADRHSAFNRITLVARQLGPAKCGRGQWGDAGSDTLCHILESCACACRICRVRHRKHPPLRGVAPAAAARAATAAARCARTARTPRPPLGDGRIILERASRHTRGFSAGDLNRFVRETGVPGILGNVPPPHRNHQGARRRAPRTGKPIVSTRPTRSFRSPP